MKVLISAYSCEPGRGSEPGVGWNVAKEIAKYHQVWVLTRPDESKEAIEAQLARNPDPNLNFVYFTLPFWQDSMSGGQSGAMQLHYYLWQIQAYFVARRLHREIAFDLAHHVTFVRYSCPSFISLLPIPFLWGPVGGGETAPRPFWRDFSFRAKVYETARLLWRWIGEHDPFVRLTIKNSAVIRATTKDTVERLHKLGAKRIEIAPESGIPTAEINTLAQYKLPQGKPMRFISMGRLLHWKGFHLGMRAFAEAQLPDAEYWVCGDGAEKATLVALVEELGISRQVKFWGRLPREETLNKLSQCHVLVHPSLHDSGGWVCIEAMAAGRPVICLDLGGPGTQVTELTGCKIPAITPEQAVTEMAEAMKLLATNPQMREKMGKQGQQLVSANYTWEARTRSSIDVYDKITTAKI